MPHSLPIFEKQRSQYRYFIHFSLNFFFKAREFILPYTFTGVSIVTRKLAESSTPTVEIKQEGDEFVIKTIAFKNSEIRFKLGEEFEEKRLDGATVKV